MSSIFVDSVPDPHIVADYSLDTPETSAVVGSVFLVREKGVVPYEYSCVPSEIAAEYRQLMMDLDETFFVEWATLLDKNGLSDKLGITILETDSLEMEDLIWLECSDKKSRMNVAWQERSVGFDSIPTIWRVTKGGDIFTVFSCSCSLTKRYCVHCGMEREIINDVCSVCGTPN